MALPTSAFTEGDQASIRRLYSFLQRLFEALSAEEQTRQFTFQTFLDGEDLDALITELRTLGAASCQADPSPRIASTLHDVRGGGLTPLLGQLDLWRFGVLEKWPGDSLYFLTRDHLKIMRNALLGLDDGKRDQDLEIKVHGTDFFVEKWNGSLLASGERKVLLEVDCPQPVAISECCVEFGALDRILYNLINNACRHASSESIQLILFPVPDPHGENLRFVLLNSLNTSDQAHLHDADLQSLFRAGVSTTGSGFGLHVAAEFVTNAFGLPTTDEAVGGGYLGAQLLHEQFAIWFHWPIVAGY
jgi:signal transduction histidine kinase